nr:NAD-dependent epimerase/dehydratase family protein [Nocardia transvalensis]
MLTGAAGFLGSHVRRALVAADHDVIAVDAMLEAVHGAHPALPPDVSRVDVRDPERVEALLRGVDVVCHLAAAVSPGVPDAAGGPVRVEGPPATDAAPVVADPDDSVGEPTTRPVDRHAPTARPSAPVLRAAPMFAAHNDFGTAVLLAAMERAGVRRLVLGSSVSVYGEGRYRAPHSGPYFPTMRRRADLDRGMFDHRAPRTGEILTWEPVGEEAPHRPRTAHAASKVAQENFAFAWGVATGGAVTVLRYHHIYGDPAADCAATAARSGVAARFRADLEAGRPPIVFEDGGQVRDLLHVRDAATATVAAVERSLPGFVPLNIASGHPITLWEVASIMSRARGGPEPVVSGRYRAADIRHIVAHHERARHALDFTAHIPPTQGLADYARSTTAVPD